MPSGTNVERWLDKKRKKAQFWQVKMFLNGLRLQFKEAGIGTDEYYIFVPLFGVKFKFNDSKDLSDNGWKVFFIDKEKMEKVPEYFRDDVMWYLVEKGYMAYLRESTSGAHQEVYKKILIGAGWGTKIMRKRLELCGKSPENTFMKLRVETFLKLPLPKIISYCPGFFDYLM